MEVTRYTLDNGLQVVLKQRNSAPVVACNVWVNVGSADEEPREAGLAHVHEHMLFKGTKRRGVGEIASEVEASGGYINAFTSFDQTCYYIVMSSRQFETGIDILADVIQNSAFDADELGRELEVIQEEIKRGNDSPQRNASQMLFDTTYQKHPYRLPVIGTKESVDSFKRENVVEFFDKHYRPDNMTLVLVGDFEEEDAKGLVDKHFATWSAAEYSRPARTEEPPQTTFRGAVDAQDIIENHMRMAFHIPDIMDEDIPAIDVLSGLLGFGDSSHLHQTIQREQELVNGVYAMAYTPKDAGIFLVGADYQLEDQDKTHVDIAHAVLAEVFRYRQFRAIEQDIGRVKTLLESQEVYGKQTVEGLAMKLGRSLAVTGGPDFGVRYYARLAKVTSSDVIRVARKYLTTQNLTLTLLRTENSGEVSVAQLQKAAETAYESVEVASIDGGISLDSHGLYTTKIPNGPTLVVQEGHSVETFALRAVTLGGLRMETPKTNGLGALLSELVVKGTPTRDAVEIARQTEGMASGIGGMAGRNSFGISMSGMSKFFDPCFDIFADCTLNSIIPQEELDRDRRLQLQAIVARQDQLASVNFRRFSEGFFGDYPYSMPILGTPETLASFDAESARSFLSDLIRPEAMVVTVVGDVDAGDVVQKVTDAFVSTEKREVAAPVHSPVPSERSQRLFVGDLEKEQAYVTVGFDAPIMVDEQRYALDVLSAILSGQGGRLFYELRDKQSLAYSVYASSIVGIDASAFTINIGTSPEKIVQALDGIYAEVTKLQDGGVTTEEIERAKTFLIGNHDIGLQKNSSRAMSFALDELYGFGYMRSLNYADYISNVTSADIDTLISDRLVLDRAVVAITKPAATVVELEL